MEYEKQIEVSQMVQRTDRQIRENFHTMKGRTDIYLSKNFDLGCELAIPTGKKSDVRTVFSN